MDVFNFCWMTLLHESKKNNVFFDKNTCNVRNDIDENFNKPVNRISFLYKFGSYNICLFHQCFREFFTKAPDSLKIIDNFRSLNNLNICSMSVGPGTDIIGLLYSLYLVDKPLLNSIAVKVISRHGSWRNVATEMMSSSIISVPESSTCKLIECDFLKEVSKKAQGYLKAADVLLMCNSFSSSITPEKVISNTLQRVIHLLKPGALVFFIDSKEKSTYFKEIDSFGTFLYGPVEVILEDMPYNEKIAELVGVKPLCSGRSLFAVWQKLDKINLQKEEENSLNADSYQHSSANLINFKSNVKDIKSPILSMSNLNREFSSDTNISSSDSIASSSQFSSSGISSQITKRREKEPVVSDHSLNFCGHKIDVLETNFNFAKNISPASVDATDSLLRKKYAPQCGSGPKKKENNGIDMNSILKSFESLVTKFEGLISSQGSLNPSSVEETQTSSDQHSHQNMHQGHCRCVKPCQFKGNSSACCHSMMCYNDTNHYCSPHVASNLYRTLPQEGPCLVIPLQNLSNECLVNILSIISQNSSENKTTTLLQKGDDR